MHRLRLIDLIICLSVNYGYCFAIVCCDIFEARSDLFNTFHSNLLFELVILSEQLRIASAALSPSISLRLITANPLLVLHHNLVGSFSGHHQLFAI